MDDEPLGFNLRFSSILRCSTRTWVILTFVIMSMVFVSWPEFFVSDEFDAASALVKGPHGSLTRPLVTSADRRLALLGDLNQPTALDAVRRRKVDAEDAFVEAQAEYQEAQSHRYVSYKSCSLSFIISQTSKTPRS